LYTRLVQTNLAKHQIQKHQSAFKTNNKYVKTQAIVKNHKSITHK